MYINSMGIFVPELRVPNEHFLEVNGLTSEWIEQRTGIKTRSKVAPDENIDTMAIAAVEDAVKSLPYDVKETGLIVSAHYCVHSVFPSTQNMQPPRLPTNDRFWGRIHLNSKCSAHCISEELCLPFPLQSNPLLSQVRL